MNQYQRTNPVGAAFRRLRLRAGVSTRALAAHLGVATSYVSKIELGQLRVQLTFCDRVAQSLRLEPEDAELLRTLATLENTRHTRVGPDGAELSDAQEAIHRLERVARSIKVLDLSVIPALLQTREYMAEILRRIAPRNARNATAKRLDRQSILRDESRRFAFLLSAWALGPHWCSPAIMARQRTALVRLAKRPHIRIRVLDRGLRFPDNMSPLVSGFEILNEAVVIQDALVGFATFHERGDIRRHTEAFEQAVRVARELRAD